MKNIKINNLLNIVFAVLFVVFGIFSCTDIGSFQDNNSNQDSSMISDYQTGKATVKMFVPDYYAMAEKSEKTSSRAVAPQTYSVRLSAYNSVSLNWDNFDTVLLSDAEKTEIENTPEGFSGSVYTITFSKVYAKSYEKDTLKVSLLDSSGNEITSGTNATVVTVKNGDKSAQTTFYTLPVNYDDGDSSLLKGQMKFKRFVLAANTRYTLHVDVSGSVYPDVAVFAENGVFEKYYSVSDVESSRIVFEIQDTMQIKYIGVWADEGAVTKYTLGLYTDLQDFEFKDSSIGFWAGENYQINLTPIPSDAYLGTPIYTSSNDAIKVSEDGVITADKEAEGTVTVTCGEISHEIAVNVYESATELTGVLSGDLLHWTKNASPYKVTGNVLIEENTELTVDAGVKVYFAGNYYIKMNGTVAANGTKDEPIVFTKAASYNGTWGGITVVGGNVSVVNSYTYSSGNIFKNCEFSYTGGYNNGNRVYPLTLDAGAFVDSCKFTDNSNFVYVLRTSYLINNYFEQGICIRGGSSFVVNNQIENEFIISWAEARVLNNTITNAEVDFEYPYSNFIMSANDFVSSTFNFSNLSDYSWSVTGNNFDCSSLASNVILDLSDSFYSSCKAVDFTGNYWGESETQELISAQGSGEKNLSFIKDYYDNFENTKVDYSGWVSGKIQGTGYVGDGFIAFDYTINGYNFENGGYYPETKDTSLAINITPKYHANNISYVKVAQGYENLSSADWQTYSDAVSFTADLVNLSDGYAPIYVQLKDSEGNVSSTLCHKVPFDSPKIVTSLTDGNIYTSAATSITYSFGATDGGRIEAYSVFLDGLEIMSDANIWGTDYTFISSGKFGLAYMSAGSHTITLSVTDVAGNTTTENYTFTITRADSDKSGLAGTSWDASTGQPLKDDRTVYLWHLDTDGSEATDTTATLSGYTSTDGGLNGAASYVYTNDSIALDLSRNAFTVEYWIKGNNEYSVPYLDVKKESSIWFYSDDYLYYKTSDSIGNKRVCSISIKGDGNWHYIAKVYGTTYFATYIDGVLVSYTDDISITLNNSDSKLYMYLDNADAVDEIRISNYARSADEIKAYYDVAKDFIK